MSMTGRHLENKNWFNVNIGDAEIARAFDEYARQEGRTRSKHVGWLITEYVKNKQARERQEQ